MGIDGLLLNRLEGFEVGVDIGNNGDSHAITIGSGTFQSRNGATFAHRIIKPCLYLKSVNLA